MDENRLYLHDRICQIIETYRQPLDRPLDDLDVVEMAAEIEQLVRSIGKP